MDSLIYRAVNPCPLKHHLGSLFRVLLSFAGLSLLLGYQARDPSVTLAMLGDVMLGRGVAAAHMDGNWETALASLAPRITHADLALANLESPLTTLPLTLEEPAYDLRAPRSSVNALTSAGLDMLALANNHSLDSGIAGLNETRNVLLAAGLTPLNAGPTPVWRTINGLKLAFLAFEDVQQPLEVAHALQAISQARAHGGLVIVSIHWGSEYHPGPDPRQLRLAQDFADAGVTLVWGHHPHVLQRIAWIQGQSQPHPTLVAFSLGNALFDQVVPADTRRSILLSVVLNGEGVQSVQFTPFEIDVRNGQVKSAQPAAAAAIHRRLGPFSGLPPVLESQPREKGR